MAAAPRCWPPAVCWRGHVVISHDIFRLPPTDAAPPMNPSTMTALPHDRTAYFISDGTGITAETFGMSLLSQFDDLKTRNVRLPFTDSPAKAHEAVARIKGLPAWAKIVQEALKLKSYTNLRPLRELVSKIQKTSDHPLLVAARAQGQN